MHDDLDFGGMDDFSDTDHHEEIPSTADAGRGNENSKPKLTGKIPAQPQEERSFVEILKERVPEHRLSGKKIAFVLGSAAVGAVLAAKVYEKREAHNQASPAR